MLESSLQSPNHSARVMCIQLLLESKQFENPILLVTWVPKSASSIPILCSNLLRNQLLMVLVDDVVIALEGSFSFIKKLKVDIILRQQPDCKRSPFCHCGPPAWPHCFSPVSTPFSHSCVCSRVRPCSPHKNHVLLLISANIFSSNINSKIWN